MPMEVGAPHARARAADVRLRVTHNPDADAACHILRQCAALNRDDPIREGNLLRFGGAGQLVMTGDMHGNLRNFEKLQRYCDLARTPARCVILHELVHSELRMLDDRDFSIDLLVRAAEWKCDFPDNVYFLQSNHELAQLKGQEITKGGRSVLHDFAEGVALRYGRAASEVLEAVNEYISSLPLAARTQRGIWISHSLPDPLLLENFDLGVFERTLTSADVSPGGPAYSLVWGRFHSPEAVEYFCRRVDAACAIVGHTPQEMGFTVIGDMIILASDHNHGAFLPIDLSKEPDIDRLEAAIRKFVSVE